MSDRVAIYPVLSTRRPTGISTSSSALRACSIAWSLASAATSRRRPSFRRGAHPAHARGLREVQERRSHKLRRIAGRLRARVRATFIVRGIRALSDFEFEFEMANMNRSLRRGDRDGLPHDRARIPVRLGVARERARGVRGPIDKYVPANVAKRLKAEMGKQGMRTGATEAND